MTTGAELTAVEWEEFLVYQSNDTETLRGVNVVRTYAGMFAEVRDLLRAASLNLPRTRTSGEPDVAD